LTFRNEIVQGPGGSQILLDDPSGNPVELFQPANGAATSKLLEWRRYAYQLARLQSLRLPLHDQLVCVDARQDFNFVPAPKS
jgi:hypothetical protein